MLSRLNIHPQIVCTLAAAVTDGLAQHSYQRRYPYLAGLHRPEHASFLGTSSHVEEPLHFQIGSEGPSRLRTCVRFSRNGSPVAGFLIGSVSLLHGRLKVNNPCSAKKAFVHFR